MSILLIVGIIINTMAFGVMGFRNQKLGIKVPKILLREIFNIPITVIYYLSFVVILLSPDSWLQKIIIALSMQFLINHIIWGSITGIVAGIIVRRNK
ncbi:MAG: hypothetical protein WC764_00205 [Candidatus Paceibacterota bacterium]|jgi:hypothetical protein